MNATYSFDPLTGVVSGPLGWQKREDHVAKGSWVVCEHLRPTLRALLDAGARIEFVTGPGSWSLIDLDVSLDRVIPPALPPESSLGTGVTFWSNTDSHYPIQSGLNCKPCRQTLSWPPVGNDAGSIAANTAEVGDGDVA